MLFNERRYYIQGFGIGDLIIDHNDSWAFTVPGATESDAGQDPEGAASSLRSCLQRNLPYRFLSNSTLSDPGRAPSVVYIILEDFL